MKDKYYIFKKLDRDNIIEGYTKIPYNFSRKYVDKEVFDKEFKEIEKDFNYEFKDVKYMKQVHSNNIMIVDDSNRDVECYEDYDGLITNLKNVLLLTNTADCQTVLLYDPVKKVIGNIHSGWKGTLKRILSKAINIMIDRYGCNSKDIIVCISPSIHKCCFEVEDDVIKLFKEEFDDIDRYITIGEIVDGKQKYYLDTIGINLRELDLLGIDKDNIEVASECTKCNSNIFHSYRVEGIGTGQNLGFIMMR